MTRHLPVALLVLCCAALACPPARAAAPASGDAATYPQLKVEGGFDNAQLHGVRVEDAGSASPRVVIAGSIDVEGMPEKGRDPNRFLHWHFRLTGGKGRLVRFELYLARANPWPMHTLAPTIRYGSGAVELARGLKVTSYGPAQGRFSEKVGVGWEHRLRENVAYASYCLPFTNDSIAALVTNLNARGKGVTVNELGRTPLFDLPLYQVVITDPAVPDADKVGVWLVAGEDPWEMPGMWALSGFLRFAASDTPMGAEFRKRFVVSGIPHVNPDALHRGDTNFYMDANARDLINTGLSWKRTDIAVNELIKTALRTWKDDGRAVDLMTSMHSSCFWAAVMRTDWAYDAAAAEKFTEVFTTTYIPHAAGQKMGTPSEVAHKTLGATLGAELWPDRLLYFGQHLEQILFPKSKVLGTTQPKWPDELANDLLRCQPPDLLTQGELFARAVADFYGLKSAPADAPPYLMCGDVDAYWGPAAEHRTYTVLYRDLAGREAKFVRLHVGKAIVEMKREAGQTPVNGILFAAAAPPAAEGNDFHFEASNGQTTIRYPTSGRLPGPYAVPQPPE